jgi:hypothetical protein
VRVGRGRVQRVGHYILRMVRLRAGFGSLLVLMVFGVKCVLWYV